MDELVSHSIELPGGGKLRVLQPADSAELPDEGSVEWAPIAPYWEVLWRSGVALARGARGRAAPGLRVVELGCGLGVPSIVAARAGAAVLATDVAPEALELVRRNAEANGVSVEAALADWAQPGRAGQGEVHSTWRSRPTCSTSARAVAQLLSLLPRLAPVAWLADPGRPAADAFTEQARRRGWLVETRERGVVQLHRLRLG